MTLQKLLLGASLFFVEKGKMIDGVEVSALAIPDVDPETNWDSLGCANDLNPFVETEADTPITCFDGNKFTTQTPDLVTSDGWNFSVNSHNEILYRLLLGIDGEIQDGTPLRVYESQLREVEGYLKFQARNVHTQGDVWVMNIWGKLSFASLPTYGNKTVLPQLRFEKLDSVNNVAELTNVV